MSDATPEPRWVEISFDCLPLRSVSRVDPPFDASDEEVELFRGVKQAIETHGTFNTYYLYNGICQFHLTNNPDVGTLKFSFCGTAFTDDTDQKTVRCDVTATLMAETCDWISANIVDWFADTVKRSVAVEFNRFIDAGDLEQAEARLQQIRDASDEAGGYVGMFL
jgi:hypothetical protein